MGEGPGTVEYDSDAVQRFAHGGRVVEPEGSIRHIQFLGKDSPHPHGLKTGQGAIRGLLLQWQEGKQVNLWPKELAKGELKFPSFIKVGTH